VVTGTLGAREQPPIARQGQAFAREQLTTEALHCYWLGALQRYAELYFLPDTPKQLEAEGSSSGGGGAAEAAAGAQGADVAGPAAGSGTAGSVGEGNERKFP
jgi:hypothetical protein